MVEANYGLIVHSGEVLPWGWSVQRVGNCMFRIVTPPHPNGTTRADREMGVVLPLVNHPMVGTEAERRAHAELEAWRASGPHSEDELPPEEVVK